jgi:hypothetical protein
MSIMQPIDSGHYKFLENNTHKTFALRINSLHGKNLIQFSTKMDPNSSSKTE